jgi:hypothetical protein
MVSIETPIETMAHWREDIKVDARRHRPPKSRYRSSWDRLRRVQHSSKLSRRCRNSISVGITSGWGRTVLASATYKIESREIRAQRDARLTRGRSG